MQITEKLIQAVSKICTYSFLHQIFNINSYNQPINADMHRTILNIVGYVLNSLFDPDIMMKNAYNAYKNASVSSRSIFLYRIASEETKLKYNEEPSQLLSNLVVNVCMAAINKSRIIGCLGAIQNDVLQQQRAYAYMYVETIISKSFDSCNIIIDTFNSIFSNIFLSLNIPIEKNIAESCITIVQEECPNASDSKNILMYVFGGLNIFFIILIIIFIILLIQKKKNKSKK